MKISDLFKRQASQKPAPTTKKLKTTARRASLPMEESYDDDEPNVRLSRAFLIVMLLHVVAVGGIFAFSSLKKDNSAQGPVADNSANETSVAANLPADSKLYTVVPGDTLGGIATENGVTSNDLQTANKLAPGTVVKPGDKLMIPAKSSTQPVPLDVQNLLKLSKKPEEQNAPTKSVDGAAPKTGAPTASGKFYTVQKGDNPVAIAKHLKVKYADLISVNKITDPKKLQIGQKLIIPNQP